MYRLRDLDRRGRRFAAVLALLIALPFAVAVLRAHASGWEPSGDNGIIALQAFDATSADPPLVGLPSTAGVYVEANPRHPGPIEFYALALPMKALGPALGMVTWTAFVNLASVLVAAWVIFRRAGPAVGAWGAVVVGAIAWAQGPAQLVDPVSSNAGGIPMLALAVLAVALASGDRRLLPLFAVFSAYVTQQHLGVFGFGVALTLGGLVGLGIAALRARLRVVAAARADTTTLEDAVPAGELDDRASEVGDDDDPWSVKAAWRSAGGAGLAPASGGEGVAPERAERWFPWLAGAFAVTVVLWLPVLIDTVTADPSNLSKLSHYSGSNNRQTVGTGAGLRQAARALGVPPLIGRTDLSGSDLVAPLSLLGWLGAVVMVAFLVRTVRRRWTDRPVLAWSALVALCLAATGAVIGANVPAFEADRLNLYRWSFVVSALAWLVVGWEAGLWIAAGRGRYEARRRWETPWIAVFGLVAITAGACTAAGPITARDGELFRTERALNDRVVAAVAGKRNVLIVPFGALASRSLVASLAVDLEAHGHRALVPSYEVANYGDHRSLANEDPDTVIVIRTGADRVPEREEGSRVLYSADLNAGRRRAYRALADQARAAPPVRAPGGEALALAAGFDALSAELLFARMQARPETVLYAPYLVDLLVAGYLSSPRLDPAMLRALQARPLPVSWGEDRIEVVEITPGAAQYLYPALR